MTNASHELPQREALERSVPFRSYIALGLGIIVGVGWVVYSGQWLQDGGPLGAMLAFLCGGLLFLPVGMCYAEMTAALPLAGGELSFSYKAFGLMPAFLTAWMLALTYVAITPFETIAIGSLLETLLPQIATEALYEVGIGDNKERVALSTILPGLLVGGFLIWVNWHGARDSARFQTIVVTALLACTVVFCGVALLRGDGLEGAEADAPGILFVADALAAAGSPFEAHVGRPCLHVADRRVGERVLVRTVTPFEKADEAPDVADVDLHAAFGATDV